MSQKLKKNYWNQIFFLDFFFLKILRYNRLKIHKIFLNQNFFLKVYPKNDKNLNKNIFFLNIYNIFCKT